MDNNVFSAIAIQKLYNYGMRKTPLYGSQALLEEEIQLQHKGVGGKGDSASQFPLWARFAESYPAADMTQILYVWVNHNFKPILTPVGKLFPIWQIF